MPARPDVVSLAELRDRDGAARVRARILSVGGGRALLADPTATTWVRGVDDALDGALVELTLNGEHASDVVVLARPMRPLARQGDVRRLLERGVARRLLDRGVAMRAVRDFFHDRRYLEVETPTLVTNPGMDVHLDAFRVEASAERFLATSPEYAMKRLVAGGFERIFQVCKSYRRDELGSLHEPEFTLCEWYAAHATADDVMRETEELVAAVARAVNGGSTCVMRDGAPLDLAPGWARTSVADAVRTHAGRELASLDEAALFEVLAFEVQPKLGRERPEWLVDWPIALASLARPKPSDPTVAERFEAYAAGIELCNGFGELTDPAEQRRRFEADRDARARLGKAALPLDERFLLALEEGMPGTSGNAVGLDRVILLVTSAASIEDVLAVPHRLG